MSSTLAEPFSCAWRSPFGVQRCVVRACSPTRQCLMLWRRVTSGRTDYTRENIFRRVTGTNRPIMSDRTGNTAYTGSQRREGEAKFHTPHVVVMSPAKCCRIKRALGWVTSPRWYKNASGCLSYPRFACVTAPPQASPPSPPSPRPSPRTLAGQLAALPPAHQLLLLLGLAHLISVATPLLNIFGNVIEVSVPVSRPPDLVSTDPWCASFNECAG